MKWKSVLSREDSLDRALDECLASLSASTEGPELMFVFAHSSLRHDLGGSFQHLANRSQAPTVLIGCTGGGIIGGGEEIELSPALSITAATLPGTQIRGFHLLDEQLPSPDAPPEAWHELLGIEDSVEPPSFVLLADPFDFDLDALLRGLDYAYPRSAKIGGLASDARQPGGNRLLFDSNVYTRGLVGVALQGNLRVTPVVAQGCRAIGQPLTVTAGERNLIHELNGKAPLKQLEETVRTLSPRDRRLAETSLFLGFASESELSLHSILNNEPQGAPEFLIRNLIGLDPRKGSLVVGTRVRPGQTVQFHLRDAEASAQDLKRLLDRFHRSNRPPQGALLFSCLGRGEHLYKCPNHDSGEFHKRFRSAPLGGFFCNGEIGPVGASTYLHGYTSCFGMFHEP
jgi:small ligand-binding sensory domain FIST